MTVTEEITIGFLPLLDSAILIVASEMGFAAEEGLHLRLIKENSWANIRDRVAVGHFDGAHMLAPMVLAYNLDILPVSVPVIAPMALGLGGNAITVSNQLYKEMAAENQIDLLAPVTGGTALRAVIAKRRRNGAPRPVFAVVHPFSGHDYELRYWLAASGIDPENDVNIVIVPPPWMPDALKSGALDGFCVGEPWNSVAVSASLGHMATVKAAIWRSSPEKVLGLSKNFADRRPDLVEMLIRAAYRASQWCVQPGNANVLAKLLAEKAFLGVPPDDILPALTGNIQTGNGIVSVDDFFLPHQRAATFPWQSHALWFYTQMVRWGHVRHSKENALIARDSFRPDIYRRALTPMGVPVPAANLKVEGALTGPVYAGTSGAQLVLGPDGFFDGRIFDPDRIDDYLGGR